VKLRDIGTIIRQKRQDRGLTLRELSEATGLSRGYISDIERGRRQPTLRVLKALEKPLGLEVILLDGQQPAN